MQGGEHTDRGKVTWGGLRVAGLCIGVDEYTHIQPLGNAVKDAEEVDRALKKVPGCYSAVLRNPTTRASLMRSIKRHVQNDDLRNKPPRLFFFYYAGHGIEHKRRVYLVPGDAKIDEDDDPELDCVPLDMVMQILFKELDEPVRLKLGAAGAITFVFVLDSCRGSLPNSCDVDVDLEPEKPSFTPYKYTVIFSCSRTMPASDGQRGGHSPFAKAVLDAEHGFFADGITLQSAISRVSSTLKSMTKDQRMLVHGTADAIPEHFCIRPTPVSEPSHDAEFGMVSVGGGRGCNELAEFLEGNGFLPVVAARIGHALQVSVRHFLVMKSGDIDIDDEKLSFLERHHKRLLLALVDSTAHSISSRDSADSDSEASTQAVGDTSEAGDSDDDSSHLIVAGYHLGDVDAVLAHLKRFIHGLMDENSLGGAHGNLSLCTVLWISFLRGATYQPTQVGSFNQLMERIFDGNGPSEHDLALIVHLIVGDLVSHKLLGSIRKTMDEFPTRPCVASIAIIDYMVAELLMDDDGKLDQWNDNVVGGWYRSRVKPSGDFFAGANDFLRDNVGTMQLLRCVQTQSCVVFLRMPKLAAHFFFEYLDISKQQDASAARPSGTADHTSSLWQGFCLFVSNTHRMFSLTPAYLPSQSALPTVRHGMECLAHLPAQTWEMLGPLKTIKDLLHAQTGLCQSHSRASTQGRLLSGFKKKIVHKQTIP